tara:strand:+ start:7803 stop:8405 length:603 start_codon:yes stop_codon:yes gene_type:complete
MTRLIGIAGPMRSGKSSIATYLHGWEEGAKVIPMADAVRDEAARLLYPNHKNSRAKWDSVEQVRKNDCRPVLQAIGHGKRTLLGEDYWVDAWMRKYSRMRSYSDALVIVDDVRYPNEVERIIELGGRIVQLKAKPETLFDRGASVESLKHPSEQSIDFDNLTLREGEMGLRRIVYHTDEVSASHIARDIKRWLAEAEGME